MGLFHSPKIVTDGLVLALDASNSKSYPGSGTSITDLTNNNTTATLNGTHSFSSEGIRITNNNSDKYSNVSYIQLGSVTNITTVSLWYRLESTASTHRYLLDMRTGGSTGWIYSNSAGSDWSSGALYLNSKNLGTINDNRDEAVTNNIGQFRNIVVVAATPATDDMNLFSRFSDNEGLDVTLAAASIYNRALSADEIAQNFQALRGRFGL